MTLNARSNGQTNQKHDSHWKLWPGPSTTTIFVKKVTARGRRKTRASMGPNVNTGPKVRLVTKLDKDREFWEQLNKQTTAEGVVGPKEIGAVERDEDFIGLSIC